MASIQGIDVEVSSYITLRPYVGSTYAWLIFNLGFRSITDLTNVTFRDLGATAGLGPKRMAAIKRALEDRGLSFKDPKDYWVQNNLLKQIDFELSAYAGDRGAFRSDCPILPSAGEPACDDAGSAAAGRPPLRLVVAHR